MEHKNTLLTLAYDGTDYFGWQRQEGVKTIQEELEKALSKLLKKEVNIRGASRTDAGVHAFCQLAILKEPHTIPINRLALAINSALDTKDIVVKDAILVNDSFHPQNSVYKKSYSYNIYNAPFQNPLCSRYSHFVHKPLDIEKMRQASKEFIGTYDFKAFCASKSMAKTTVRTIYSLDIEQKDELISINITGNGFLYNMVRIIAGTLIDVGLSKKKKEDIKEIIFSKDRQRAGKTSPACGLILKNIYYNLD